MTPLYHARKSDGRWFVRAFALLTIALPAVAQQVNVSAPLSADEVMGRVVEMNEVRAKALGSYSSVRSYHLECHCLSHKKADMKRSCQPHCFSTLNHLAYCYDDSRVIKFVWTQLVKNRLKGGARSFDE